MTDRENEEIACMLLRYAGLVRAKREECDAFSDISGGPVGTVLDREQKRAEELAKKIYEYKS